MEDEISMAYDLGRSETENYELLPSLDVVQSLRLSWLLKDFNQLLIISLCTFMY